MFRKFFFGLLAFSYFPFFGVSVLVKILAYVLMKRAHESISLLGSTVRI